MFSRGGVGELPIHLCYLYNSKVQLNIAAYMIQKDPSVLEKVYEGAVFTGENLLHIAIVKKNLDVASDLIRKVPNLLDGRAVGAFFKVRSFKVLTSIFHEQLTFVNFLYLIKFYI